MCYINSRNLKKHRTLYIPENIREGIWIHQQQPFHKGYIGAGDLVLSEKPLIQEKNTNFLFMW